MTRPDHPSGSDRIFEALGLVDPERPARHRRQRAGRPADHRARDHPGRRSSRSPTPAVDIATLAAVIRRDEEQTDPERRQGRRQRRSRPARLRALYFTRATAPWGEGAALSPYRPLRLSPRARWSASSRCRPRRSSGASGWSSCARSRPACASTSSIVDAVPLGVDTPADLERARAILSPAEAPDR